MISQLDEVPENSQKYSDWIYAEAHLKFLQENARTDELVVFASGEYTFVNSVVAPNASLFPIDQDDLMSWSLDPCSLMASYITGGGRDKVWIERGLDRTGTKALENATQLIFCRTFEGWTGSGRNYYELHQEYAHLANIHWRPENRAYCRFDERGDLEPVVSISSQDDKGSGVALVSFKWEPLEEYLVASDTSLVRMFDFTLLKRSGFSGWSNEPPKKAYDSNRFFFHRKVMPGYAAYTHGVQIISPLRPKKAVFTGITDKWFGHQNKKYAEFIAYDWRNNHITKISTNPSATANYFNAEGNLLPFELSPAFFRPEVLLKYKADRDKYTVGERYVSCRATWHLKGIDVNEAGQLHAYICDLRSLPWEEQLHWLSFNEPPKTSISNRAIINDFKGEFVTFMDPLQKILSVIQRWKDKKTIWWVLRDEKLLDRVNTPLTNSRDEWAEAFMDLAKLVVEGFETKSIRKKLDMVDILYQKEDRTIALLEKLLNIDNLSNEPRKLVGLRMVQLLRSKAKGHAGGSEAEQLAEDALVEYETFSNHFRHICAQVADELETIEELVS